MKRSLKWKLSLSYALTALLLVAAISFASNIIFRSQFEQYMIRQQESKNREIVAQVAQQFTDGSAPGAQTLETIGVSALERGMIVKVTDASGAVLWDATVHNNGFCRQMLENMARDMRSRSPNFKGGYEEKSYPVLLGARRVGTVGVGYYGPFYYSDNDAHFINTLNRVLAAIGLCALLLAVFTGIWMASRISRPIARAIRAAEQIADGNYGGRIEADSGTLELNRLTASVNTLSEKLEDQESLRRRLTNDIAHELRTPLAALQGNLEALIDGVFAPDERRLEGCRQEVLRLSRLVSGLEGLARLEDAHAACRRERVDWKEQAEKAAAGFEAQLLKGGISATVSGESGIVSGDADKLRQVFVNLISNSLKHTPPGGRISIRFLRRENAVTAEVSDTGAGIPEKDLPFVFERFYRADPSRSSRSGGAGIGLTIVKRIVELHGGRVSVRSSPGNGTTFTIVLPVGVRADSGKASGTS